MCFNMALVREVEELQQEFRGILSQIPMLGSGAPPPSWQYWNRSGFEYPEWPVITREKPEVITTAQWGLIPHWIRDTAAAEGIRSKTLNARSETLDRLPSFRSSFPRRTCIVPVDGFFEPHHFQGASYPFYIRRAGGRLLAFAGLTAEWTNPATRERLRTFSVITVPSIGLTDRIHAHKHRMPLIIPPDHYQAWLDSTLSSQATSALMNSWEPEDLEAFAVSSAIYRKSPERHTEEVQAQYHWGVEAVDQLAGQA